MQFKERLLSQEGDKYCNMCEYTTQNRDEMEGHYRDTHESAISSDGLDEAESYGDDDLGGIGMEQPKVTTTGKVKQFRCKQCSHTAMTKREFWEHTRGHIKAERLLTCPKCPFVTEYKHHFEYHLRNHFGSKPFKCDQCSYSCVNKSMLNSHLKSHSNVYQFRCSDCAYATKYCHSLKLHLRKYAHKPAMVLNPDGSPNPLPIVDVYGTRRGPKQRSKKSSEDYSAGALTNAKSISPKPPTSALSPLYPIPQSNFGILPHAIQFPYNFQFTNQIPNSIPPPQFSSSPPSSETTEELLAVEEFNKLKQLYQMNNNNNSQDYGNNEKLLTPPNTNTNIQTLSTAAAPLDLSKSEISSQNMMVERSNSSSAGKNRRKGVAVKRVFSAMYPFDHHQQQHQHQQQPLYLGDEFSDREAKLFKQGINIPSPQMLCNVELLSPNKSSESDSKSRADVPSSPSSNSDESLSGDSIDRDVSAENRKPEVNVGGETATTMAETSAIPEGPEVSDVEQRVALHASTNSTDEDSTRLDVVIKIEENNNDEIIRRRNSSSSKPTTPEMMSSKTLTPEMMSTKPTTLEMMSTKPTTPEMITSKATTPEIMSSKPTTPEMMSSKPTTPDTSCSNNSTDENDNNFRCSFCDIIFKNLAMYSIHMGFHDYRDPFTCNMCGHKTKDEMAFFLHIARFPHS